MSHDSFDHLQALLLSALKIAEGYQSEEERDESLTYLRVAFQQIKDDELEAIKWPELKKFLNELEINLV